MSMTLTLLVACVALPAMSADTPAAGARQAAGAAAAWIWDGSAPAAPKNRFTWFRKVVTLEAVPADARLRIAADSNAALWINGHNLLRKVPRYHQKQITSLEVDAAPFLRPGRNVILVRHHNWGDIITFQRTANTQAGLWIESNWLVTDASWECRQALEYMPHDKQVVGVIKDPRIRYPQIIDGHEDKADGEWHPASVVEKGPWPPRPEVAETPAQREHPVIPLRVLAAGRLQGREAPVPDPFSMAAGIRTARCEPSEEATRAAGQLLSGRDVVIEGKAGEWRYITFDFGMPVHGYPFLQLDGLEGATIDFGYCELARAQYSGAMHVQPDGWLNPEGVVGPGYADRYITGGGLQRVEVPDERTARWLALHVHFPRDGQIVLKRAGIIKSQYPVDWKGSFTCGDECIEQIVKLCLIHAEVTMSDTYVDTPGREDGQWIEDARPRAVLAARWFGDTKLLELMIRTLAQSQGNDGHLHPFAPSNYPAYPAAYDWSVQWVAMLYDHYMWTGDAEGIRRYYEPLKRYWANVLSKLDEEGLWRTRHVLADLRVGLHPENDTQSSGIVMPWMIERLQWSAVLAGAIGDEAQADNWNAAAAKMTKAFRKYHIVPAEGRVPAHVADRVDPAKPELERGYSQAGQTIAVTANLLTPEEALATVQYAFAAPDGSPPKGVTRWNNPTYGYRVLRAMSHVGMTDRAIAHLIERYAPYLPGHPRNLVPLELQGPYGGPLPEYWVSREDLGLTGDGKNNAQPHDETGSHGWGSVPLLWLHDTLLGVTISKPGGGEIRIAPDAGSKPLLGDFGGLPFVSGHTVTPKGIVWIHWEPQRARLETTIPAGVVAEVVVPQVGAGAVARPVQAAGKVENLAPQRFRISGAGRYVFAGAE